MIVHLTNSTISGAAAMLAAAQRRAGKAAIVFQFADNGSDRQLFSSDLLSPSRRDDWIQLVNATLAQAKVVHVHNWLPADLEEIVYKGLRGTGAVKVWHLHQGNFERPIYTPATSLIKYDRLAVVAHAFARTLPDFVPMPNCLYRQALEVLPKGFALTTKPKDKVGVVFSPSTKEGARWSKKFDESFQQKLEDLRKLDRIRAHVTEKEPPVSLLFRRQAYDITIDEVVTGGYHLVSYEGLATANCVVNGADWVSIETMKRAFQTNKAPPFVYANTHTFMDVVLSLAYNEPRLRQIQADSLDYFETVMNPMRVVDIYDDFYGIKS